MEHLAPCLIESKYSHLPLSTESSISTDMVSESQQNLDIIGASIHVQHPCIAAKNVKKRKSRKEVTPKLYLCYICSEDCVENPDTFEKNSICCSKCNRWLHFGCVNIQEEQEMPKKSKVVL